MIFRVEIGLKNGVPDARARKAMEKVKSFLGVDLSSCCTRDVYKVNADIAESAAEKVCRAYTDPVVSESALGRLTPPEEFDWVMEIGFKPGVTDNVGRTARNALQDVLARSLDWREQVYSSVQYFIGGEISREELLSIGRNLLANTLIQTISVHSHEEWLASDVDLKEPLFEDCHEAEVKTIELPDNDAALMRISREGILSLSIDEMRAIREHYLREDIRAKRAELGLPGWPTDVELECIAQTWSEHCSHKIFAAQVDYEDMETGEREEINSLFKSFVMASTERIAENVDWLVSVFTDNAGIIKFDDKTNLAYKVETHNSPSALDPYGGAMTGIVGVNRDPMGTGMGCELLSNVWGYCLGSPFFEGNLPEGLMHPRRIRDGVHSGVIDGGNQSGIPWSRGFECFDERYLGKPLVYCGTLGSTPVKVGDRPSERKEIAVGDLIVMVGGRIGKDGIHGATFSSEELRTESPAQAVQIGDPLTQRKMYEFLMEAREKGLYRCITDNGAGGISCSFGEMGEYSGGCDCELAKAPLKYEGLQPWEILLSEAQERMTVAVPPEQRDQLAELARKRDVEIAFMGTFNDKGDYTIRYNDRIVGSLDMDFLYESGCPTLKIPARWKKPDLAGPKVGSQREYGKTLVRLMADLNLCSREYKSRMYDGEVKGLSVVKPFVGVNSDVPSDATVMRIAYDSNRGAVLSEGINPWFSDLDTYHMTTSVIDEAVRKVIAVGGSLDRIAILDNFCWPDPVESEKTPDGAYKMAQLVRSNKALYDLSTAYGVPPISGKDSCKNDSVRGGRKISIPPTLLISAVGQIEDLRKAVTVDFKRSGDAILMIGETGDEMGASALYRFLAKEQGAPRNYGGRVPRVAPERGLKTYRAMNKALERELLHSSTSPAKGGLAVALTLAAIGGQLGADIDLSEVPGASDLDDLKILFSESNSRFIISCDPAKQSEIEELFADLPTSRIGTVVERKSLHVKGLDGSQVIGQDLDTLSKSFKGTLYGV